MFATVGWSTQAHAFTAGQTAATMALRRLANRAPRGALMFGSSWFDQRKLVEGARSVLGGVPLAGGSTAGEIVAEGPQTHSCAVLALGDDDVSVGVGIGTDVQRDPRLAGFRAAQEAAHQVNGQARRGVLFFGDGLCTSSTDVVHGIQEVVGTGTLVVGALMGDDLRFLHTSQYAHGQVLSDAVVTLLLGGNVTLGVGMQHGFAPISKPWRVTRAEENRLCELDGQPAAAVYEDYVGAELLTRVRGASLSRQLLAYPLGVQERVEGPMLLRNIMAFGQDGSLACTGHVMEGAVVHVMISSRAQALEAASRAAQEAVQSLTAVSWVLVFDSVARKRLLGRETAEAIGRIRQVVGASVPLIGCYTYGEHAAMLHTGAILVLAVGQ